jgi:hypothetical protein
MQMINRENPNSVLVGASISGRTGDRSRRDRRRENARMFRTMRLRRYVSELHTKLSKINKNPTV